ncbi:hypothetical protein K0B96_06905 [Horticoccus luteus]|uniref:Uncharacterized protein n=1 Tax=Horticoccus luteus TaxID=2862869 RepID=A0A8F9XIF0_9BACT|nr:hypothetical protein [Horticoccus luteus]QYM80335.1 hypothetical protein K0B96_06905 [Horticoccus luteus]
MLATPAAGDRATLRVLTVEERAGAARENALVRVPLFFAEGECREPGDVVIVDAAQPGRALTVQADDVRRGPDGGVSRMHLWFEATLRAGEKKQFLLRRGGDEVANRGVIPVHATADGIEVKTTRGEVAVGRDGGLRRIVAGKEAWDFGEAGLTPSVHITYSDHSAGVKFDGVHPANRAVAWSAGPLFVKVVTRMGDDEGAHLEQTLRISGDGREVDVSGAVFLGARQGGKLEENLLLTGEGPARARVTPVPAGVRPDLRNEHAYAVDGLAGESGGNLLAVPVVIGGSNGRWAAEGKTVSLSGFHGVSRGKEEQKTLRAFWTEVALLPTAAETAGDLWPVYRAAVQPLVAIVDEPGVEVATLHEALAKVVRSMRPVNWAQEAGRFHVLGETEKRDAVWRKQPSAGESDAARLVERAKAATARLNPEGWAKLKQDEKSRASGPLDPYHLTYTLSAGAALSALGDAPPRVGEAIRAMAEASREYLGRADADGSPYIDCYSRALNMQMGPMLFGLAASAEGSDATLTRFYRDLATTPVMLGVFGRGERPYVATRRNKPDYTDYLYQAISDFWLRTAELLAHENLQLHPLAFGRYTDCVDVLADRYHALDRRDNDGTAGEVRANFFRGQGHTHRWLGWSCAPFIRLLADPAEKSQVGLTEAIRYARSRAERWNNWPDLTFYLLTDLMTRQLPDGSAPALPPRPNGVRARVTAQGTELSWGAVSAAVSYRIYRADESGGPWIWLNSPYAGKAVAPTSETVFADSAGGAGKFYVVLSVDASGRASAWPLDAPCAVEATAAARAK